MKTWWSELDKARAGDVAAFGEVVREFQDMAVGYAYAVLGDFDLAEDAAQEAFVEAWQVLANLREPKAFPGWLRRIVFKHCDRLTRRKRPASLSVEDTERLPSGAPSPAELAQRRELGSRVIAAIAALPADERTAVALFYINGYSQAEVSEFLDVPVSTIKSRLHSARNHLREGMMDMVEETLKEHAPTEDFSTNVMDKMNVMLGDWVFENGELRGRQISDSPHGRKPPGVHGALGLAFAKQSWPGDALVIEYDAIAPYGHRGIFAQSFMSQRPNVEQLLENKEFITEFTLRFGAYGNYYWSGVVKVNFHGRWSREMGMWPAFGNFSGARNRWYHVKAERVGQMCRLWADGVPIHEWLDPEPVPERLWPAFGATVCPHNRFKNIKIYRPDKATIRKHGKPLPVFEPYQQKMRILEQYPDKIERKAWIELGDQNKGQELIEWTRAESKPTVAEFAIQGKACRRTDLAGDQWSALRFRLEQPRPWQGQNDLRLEIEYLDNGTGSIVAGYDTWYFPSVFTEDLIRTNSGKWKKHTWHLREVAFRDLGSAGENIFIFPLRGEDLYLRSVRLVEVSKPAEAYEAVIAAFRAEMKKRKGTWPVGHYLFQIYLILAHNLTRPQEANQVVHELIEQYPDCECIDTLQQMRACYSRMY